MGFGVHPIFLIAAVTLFGAVTCLVLACLASGWLKRIILVLVALILLAPSGLALAVVKPELFDARVRTYKRLYADIETGMVRSEVMELVDRHYPADGKRLRPKVMRDTESELGFFMNPETSREPNCEGIFLELRSDKVVSKRYSAD